MDQAILFLILSENTVRSAGSLPGRGIPGKPLDLDREELRSAVAALLAGVSHRNAGEGLDSMYQHLVAPFHDAIGKRKLLIVPHDALHSLPFGALRQNGRYLAQDLSIYYSPSIAVWQLLKREPLIVNPGIPFCLWENLIRMLCGRNWLMRTAKSRLSSLSMEVKRKCLQGPVRRR